MARTVQSTSVLNVKNFVTGDGDAYGLVWVDELGVPVLRHISDIYDAADPLLPLSFLRARDPADKSSGDGRADVWQGRRGAAYVLDPPLADGGNEQIDVTNAAAVGFTQSFVTAGARACTFSISGTADTFVRMLAAGNPTTGAGVLLPTFGGWDMYTGPLTTTEFIAVTTDCTLDVQYWL